MALKLYFHPLASFCHKALIALYENRVAFEPIIVDLRDEASRAAFRAVWPMAKMPVLRAMCIGEQSALHQVLYSINSVFRRIAPRGR
jgi:glutathione S-transferase